jgi:GMP synthase (glutamine-hydrolysing)
VEAGCTLEVVHPYAGDPVPTLDGYAGLLVMGGAMGANDDETLEWIGPVKELIRDAVAEGVPTLGICLGHQLMAAALGGRVTPNPRGQQVGLIPVGWTDAAADDRLFGGLATPRRGVQWNYDVVVEPPPGAEVLAHTGDGEVQVARYAPTAWGVQLHPEVDETIVGTWVTDSERGELAGRGLDADALLADIKEAREELDQAWAPLAAGFADVALGPPDPSRRG